MKGRKGEQRVPLILKHIHILQNWTWTTLDQSFINNSVPLEFSKAMLIIDLYSVLVFKVFHVCYLRLTLQYIC